LCFYKRRLAKIAAIFALRADEEKAPEISALFICKQGGGRVRWKRTEQKTGQKEECP